jgi:hypothetical protein
METKIIYVYEGKRIEFENFRDLIKFVDERWKK